MRSMSILVDFITGVSVGIELYMGEDLAPGDKFALTLDVVIIRVTFIL